jgi:hypothetical protein
MHALRSGLAGDTLLNFLDLKPESLWTGGKP